MFPFFVHDTERSGWMCFADDEHFKKLHESASNLSRLRQFCVSVSKHEKRQKLVKLPQQYVAQLCQV